MFVLISPAVFLPTSNAGTIAGAVGSGVFVLVFLIIIGVVVLLVLRRRKANKLVVVMSTLQVANMCQWYIISHYKHSE